MLYTKQVTSRKVSVDGCEIHYHEAGEGDPLIMIHGGGPGAGGWTNYHKNIEALAARRRVILPDLVGFGESGKQPVTDTLFNFHAGFIQRFMAVLEIPSADFVGNSLGGGIVLRLLLSHPDLVGSVVLMGPGGSFPIFSSWPTLGLRLGMEYYQGDGPSPDKLRRLLQMMVWDQSLITDELVDTRYRASIDSETTRNPPLVKGGKLNDEVIWREDLSAVENRVLILWGRDDDIIPFDSALVLLRQLPNAELHVIPKCGHWVMWERPELFNRAVLSFLGSDS